MIGGQDMKLEIGDGAKTKWALVGTRHMVLASLQLARGLPHWRTTSRAHASRFSR